jgi:hypothetical protein
LLTDSSEATAVQAEGKASKDQIPVSPVSGAVNYVTSEVVNMEEGNLYTDRTGKTLPSPLLS